MHQIIDYQIKSTPYFQRMLTASKKNGQLQKLKEEYERLKDFNDANIESKMRRNRLKRLFQEIEEIKNTELKKRRLRSNEKPRNKTEKDTRLENLVRAKDLGQYFSQQNVLGTADRSDTGIVGSIRNQFYKRKELGEVELKARVEKRITYGNQISSWNMQKMLMGNLRKEASFGIRKTRKRRLNVENNSETQNDPNIVEIDNSNQGISCGNTISDIKRKNIPTSKINVKISNECKKFKKRDYILNSSDLTLKESAHIIKSNLDAALFKSCDEIDNGQLQPMLPCNSNKTRGKTYWNKIKNQFDNERFKNLVNASDKCKDALENQLRSISNDTDLLKNDGAPIKNENLNLSENDKCNNELIVCDEYLSEVTSFKISNDVIPCNSPSTTLTLATLMKSVQNPQQEVKKEVYGFQNIRQMYENPH